MNDEEHCSTPSWSLRCVRAAIVFSLLFACFSMKRVAEAYVRSVDAECRKESQ